MNIYYIYILRTYVAFHRTVNAFVHVIINVQDSIAYIYRTLEICVVHPQNFANTYFELAQFAKTMRAFDKCIWCKKYGALLSVRYSTFLSLCL